jgi:peptidoglycan/LPS O-acetylase OafA/YrhL
MPGLDGLRAIAVLGVIVYHFGIDWMPGGLLGVGVFFTLSGYLITDLLLGQVAGGGIRLGEFWLARLRRLLPALVVLLVVVMAWVTVIGPHQPDDFRSAVLTAALYVNNWWLIFHDVSYFAQFEAPGPLNHIWSLSIEEQFYFIWPLLVMLAVKLTPPARRQAVVRPRWALATLGLALLSAILMALLYKSTTDPSRVYYGTDTRAMELLVGAALAMVWPSRRLRAGIAPRAVRMIDAAGVIGLVGIALMFWRTSELSPFLYRGGFLVLSLATALLVATLAHPASRLGPLLGARPLRWVGERSYGIYLWHFPIIVLTTPARESPTNLVRNTLQLAAIFAIAALSWKYLENPIRHGALGRFVARRRETGWTTLPATTAGRAAVGVCAMVVLAAVAGFAGVGAAPENPAARGDLAVAKTVTAANAPVRAKRTSCDAVVHVGDSTSLGLASNDYLPDPKQQIGAQYARVGARTAHLEISGARSIYETFQGIPNARDVAQAWRDDGFEGCWVFALGTNEAANVAGGSTIGYQDRIERMMAVAERDPVLWINVRSLVGSGSYAKEGMEAWDGALVEACDRYPNMRVFDWAGYVKDHWFIDDGIHFTTPGYAARSNSIASALLTAFPAGASSTQWATRRGSRKCLIRHSDFPAKLQRPDGIQAVSASATTTPVPAPTQP